jgi:hypothetical protein
MITIMKPKTRQEMLRLVEGIREKLDLALTLVALREADASQQRAECDLGRSASHWNCGRGAGRVPAGFPLAV